MRVVDVILGVGWLVFLAGWLAAATRVKSGRTRWRRDAAIRVVVFVAIVALGRLGVFPGHASGDAALAGAGVTLFVLGLAVAVWARVHLGRNWGTPMSEKHDPQLVTTGPYRWIRNPIYAGLILAMVGTAIAASLSALLVVAVLAAYFVYSAVVEQRYLAAQFPDTYPAYRSSTKMLIPFVL